MIEHLKLIIFNSIYNNLGLENLESQIIKAGIKSKNIENPTSISLVSNYFFLLNGIHLENLSQDELDYLKTSYQNYQKGNTSELYAFLNKNISKLLFAKTESKYIEYGDREEQAAPNDSIAIAFHYNSLDCTEEQENFICDILNYIQDELSKKINMKIAVLKFGIYINNKSHFI